MGQIWDRAGKKGQRSPMPANSQPSDTTSSQHLPAIGLIRGRHHWRQSLRRFASEQPPARVGVVVFLLSYELRAAGSAVVVLSVALFGDLGGVNSQGDMRLDRDRRVDQGPTV